MRLSEHFTYEELIFSETAARQKISNKPPKEIVDELKRLCLEALEPLRGVLNRPVIVTSGYRSGIVNALVGGSKHSAHVHGRAADVRVHGVDPIDVCYAVMDAGVPYDQLIHEFGAWCHVAIAPIGALPRKQLLTIDRYGTRTGLLLVRTK